MSLDKLKITKQDIATVSNNVITSIVDGKQMTQELFDLTPNEALYLSNQ